MTTPQGAPMPGAARVFSHLALVVTDMDTMADFYVDAFGFVRGTPWQAAGRRLAGLMDVEPDGLDSVFLALGDFRLELLAYRSPHPPGERPRPASKPGFAHISLVVDDFAGTLAAVEAAGGRPYRRMGHTYVGPGDVGPGETAIAFVLDPDGNRVEIIWHPSAQEAAAHTAFLGLTHLGWPARDQVRIGEAPTTP
ncbi:VOC family protein [Streptomyces sp. NPDC091292]|uniref:VOC family protein n=1 Tax=Streptomyces sp. NPDC091292 TaxID=3365991 RepID=UPI00380C129C